MESESGKRKVCSSCDQPRLLSDFYSHHQTRDGKNSRCIPCCKLASKLSHKAGKGTYHRKAGQTRRYGIHAESVKKRAADWAKRNPDRRKLITKKSQAKRKTKIKKLVFDFYGGAACRCCGEDNEIFLTMDHMNNDGARHRREIKEKNLAEWLYKNKFPPGFQVLCRNCNWGKYANKGVCPHKTKATQYQPFCFAS